MDALSWLFPLCMIVGLIALKIYTLLRVARNSDWTTLARLYPAGLAAEGTPFSLQSGYVGCSYFKGILFVGVSPAGLYLKSVWCPALLLPWKIMTGYRDLGFWSGDGECYAMTPQGAFRLRLGRRIWEEAAPYLPVSRASTASASAMAPAGSPAGLAAGPVALTLCCTNCGYSLIRTAAPRFCGKCGHQVAT